MIKKIDVLIPAHKNLHGTISRIKATVEHYKCLEKYYDPTFYYTAGAQYATEEWIRTIKDEFPDIVFDCDYDETSTNLEVTRFKVLSKSEYRAISTHINHYIQVEEVVKEVGFFDQKEPTIIWVKHDGWTIIDTLVSIVARNLKPETITKLNKIRAMLPF